MTTTSTGITEKRKAALIEKHRDINTDYDWWDCTYDDFVETAKTKGFHTTTKEVHFSGFWSQGDGASFTGTVDVPTFIKAHKLESAYPWITRLHKHGGDIYAKVERISRGYFHENTCRAEVTDYDDFSVLLCPSDFDIDDFRVLTLGQWDEALSADIDQLEKDIEQTRLDLCRELYRSLESEYERLTSDDAVWDTIEANDLHNQLY